MSQTLAIIDYGSGNLKSAAKAFERAALEAALDTKIIVTADPNVVAKSDRIVLPGVGAFADCRDGLFAVPGMVDALNQRVVTEAAPFLGICVGLQLMASRGLEKGVHAGLDWVAGDVDLIRPTDPALKVPHMGWNTLDLQTEHPIFAGIALGPDGLHCYFTHSYHFAATDPASVLATADYGGPITAAIGRDNMVGAQFHPEKSQAMGLALISNFLRWRP